MNVSCEKCGTDYDLEDSRIGESGLTVKCTHCGHIFQVHGDEDDPFSDSPLASMEIETPKLGAWRVRRRSGEELSRRRRALRALVALLAHQLGAGLRDRRVQVLAEIFQGLRRVAQDPLHRDDGLLAPPVGQLAGEHEVE